PLSDHPFERLVGIMRTLLGPNGCPWDREQTLETMTPYLTEEAVESVEAIASGDADHAAEELGDLGFLVLFCLELLGEQRGIGVAEAFERAADKLVRRHPHVYGGAAVADGEAAYKQWQEIKKAEKSKADRPASLLGDQPKGLPALVAAYRLQEKAAAVGFDWPSVSGPFGKIREETDEIERSLTSGDATPETAHEIGDLLFAVVNLCRKSGVHASLALDRANAKFVRRWEGVERLAAGRGIDVAAAGLEQLDRLWEEVKRVES
ncbi:MAG: nucleoside triphosphate pyrophosphohydrolase, partial [Gemmatimonadaceae bacterium]|nr:nucleoside triphosphate pyrophosphohydrolase [Gemmatimonadaceae bacterium]